jgi:hypothetical protein
MTTYAWAQHELKFHYAVSLQSYVTYHRQHKILKTGSQGDQKASSMSSACNFLVYVTSAYTVIKLRSN